MTRLLLDHPWPIGAVADETSDGFRVLEEFEKLLVRHKLSPVPFVEQQDLDNAIQRLNTHTSGRGTIYRFAMQCVRRNVSTAMATPVAEQNPTLSANWKRALRDEFGDTSRWRTPQIVIPEKRRSVWPLNADEIAIQYDGQGGLVTEYRVLVQLGSANYESHPYAVRDLDPWRHLEWLHKPDPGAKNNHPCRLPKPPLLEGVTLEELAHLLPEARRQGWKIDGKYFYIPPVTCRLDADKAHWRDGRAFPRTNSGNKRGPIVEDFEGRKWVWDNHSGGHSGERHWDVQLLTGKHKRVNHDGLDLDS